MTFAEIESRRQRAAIRRTAMKELIDFLVRGATREGQIERRVLELALALRCESLAITTQAELAAQLGFSKQRASSAVDYMAQKLTEIATDHEGDVDSAGNTAAPG